MKALLYFVICFFLTFSTAQAQRAQIAIQQNKEKVLVKISLPNSYKSLSFYLEGENLVGFKLTHKNQNKGILTSSDKNILMNLIENYNFKSEIVYNLVSSALIMLPTNEMITPYQMSPKEKLRSSYQLVCHLKGQSISGIFSAWGKIFKGTAPLGVFSSFCYGRCGPGCWSPFQIRQNQYTQECFEHDLCNRRFDSQLGPCKDEFWRATQGFLRAPNCNK